MRTPMNPNDNTTPAPLPDAVVLDQITVERGALRILDSVSCSLPAGRCTALLGPNGCGKTTLTRCITGHAFITRGRATVLGQTIGQSDIRALRKRIAVVNPTTDAGSGHVSGAVVDAQLSALEAVLTGFFATVGLYDRPTPDQTQLAEHHLRSVGLGHRIDHRFYTLSTGEQRRCLVARALVNSPQLLILDEPTAGLDIAGREQVLATVEALLSRPSSPSLPAPTVLLITHHVEEISPRTAQILLMRGGRITHAGLPADVITPESLSATFGCRVYVKRIHGRFWLEVLPEAWLDLLPPA